MDDKLRMEKENAAEVCNLMTSTQFDVEESSLESNTITSSPTTRSTISFQTKDKTSKALLCLLIFGGISLIFGMLSVLFPPFDVLMNERLRMLRGFPAYEWWKEPPDEVLMRFYVFNITNKDAFLSGKEKLHLNEIGPWVFREKLVHSDVLFNENDTMTYTAHRSLEFLSELSGNLTMDTTLVLPNLSALGMASYLWDASFFTKVTFNLMVTQYNAQPIIEMKIKDYMWNNTDPMFVMAGKIMPNLVPVTNLGVLDIIYKDFSDQVTVHIGLKKPKKFFLIDKFRGSSRLNYWEDELCDRVSGSSEGVSYPEFLTRNDTIWYLRKTICRAAPLMYTRDQIKYGMTGYKYELRNDSFASGVANPKNNCFRRKGDKGPYLPSGALDVSPCYYNFPIAASFPHFMHGSKALTDKIDNLHPNPAKHGSYALIEPLTGVPMEAVARSQSNLIVRPISGIPKFQRFSNMTVPMFWAEYNQVGLPWYIHWLMYFVVIIIPPTQQPVAFALISAGISMLLAAILALTCLKYYNEQSISGSYISLNSSKDSSLLK